MCGMRLALAWIVHVTFAETCDHTLPDMNTILILRAGEQGCYACPVRLSTVATVDPAPS